MIARTSCSLEPKWYWTTAGLRCPAVTAIWRSDTAAIPCSANRRSAVTSR